MAKAFERLEGTNRVFAPGNVSLWMNMFTDVPQMNGCCDQSIPTMEHRIATYAIYTLPAERRVMDPSVLWLQAFGAHAVGVTGPNSTVPFKPFVYPRKFDGELRELWRKGDDVIYEVPQRSPSLAHGIAPSDVVQQAPSNGLDVAPLRSYVHAIEGTDFPIAEMGWRNGHQACIRSDFKSGELLSVQISYDPHRHARVNGANRVVTSDALGMLVVDPRCDGECEVDLSFETLPKVRWLLIQVPLLALLAIGFGVGRKRQRQ